MKTYRPVEDEIVVVRNNESGQEWLAKVSHITKGGRVVAWWRQRTRKGGDAKPRTLDPTKELVVRPAVRFEQEAFERGE